MDVHVCKQCGSRFVYCRQCVFKPVRYKDAGFCSKECFSASKENVEHIIKPTLQVEEITMVEIQPEEIAEVTELQNEIPFMEDTSSFSTEECVSYKDIETTLDE